MEEQLTYAVGHLALGYLSGKATSKILRMNIYVPLLFVASLMPDVDLLIPSLEHRGPMHSLIIFCLAFLPIFVFFGKRATPYFIALVQHSLVGDYLTGGTQLLWPITANWYGLMIRMVSLTNIFMEWSLFLTSMTIMLKTKDAWLLFQHHPSNLTLSIPVLTVLLPAFLGFPLSVPLELIIPHLTYLIIFTLSIIMDSKATLMRNRKTHTRNY